MKKYPAWIHAIVICILAAGCGGDGNGTNGGPDGPPTVESVTPVDGEERVSVSTTVWIEFSQEMDTTSAEGAFSLEGDAGPVAGTATWADANMVYSPDEYLVEDTQYTVTVSTSALDSRGEALEEEFTSTFRTGISASVVTITPDDDAAGVSVDTVVEITFSTEMDTGTVEEGFSLEGPGGPVSGTFSWSQPTLTFEPDEDLVHATDYVVTIARSAKDTAGNHILDTFVSRFKTELAAPVVTGDLATDVPVFTWSAPEVRTGFRYQLDGEDGEWTEVDADTTELTVDPPPADGPHTLYVQAGYNDGEWSESGSWTVQIGPVHQGDFVINIAEDLDGFNYVRIAGNLTMEGSPLTLVFGMESLLVVDGFAYFIDNGALYSLEGLTNLLHIGGNLVVANNPYQESLVGLESLVSIGGSVDISHDYLLSFGGLDSLERIEGELRVRSNSLANMAGLDALRFIGGDLVVDLGTQMDDLSGLENLESIVGSLLVQESGIGNVSALQSLRTLGGIHLVFSDIASLAGLEGVTEIPGTVELVAAGNLTDLGGLDNLTTIGGNLLVQAHVGGPLASLSGLESLTVVGGRIELSDNDQLASLSGLAALESLGQDLTIAQNSSLPTCEAEVLRDRLLELGWEGEAYIANNDDAGTCE